MDITYRGFGISVRSEDAWMAKITNLKTGKVWSREMTIPLEEGQDKCAQRAQNLVDAFLALRGA